MAGEPHIVNIGVRIIGLVDKNGITFEFEIVDSVFAFCDSEETFAVITLDAADQTDFSGSG